MRLALLCCLLLSGCAAVGPLSTFQTARVLEPGKQRRVLGGSAMLVGPLRRDYVCGRQNRCFTTDFAALEATGRLGLARGLDAGLSITGGDIALDGKYELYGGERWAFAAGLGAGYHNGFLPFIFAIDRNTAVHALVPLYASYDLGDDVSLYASPKYAHRRFVSAPRPRPDVLNLVGLTLGARLGWDLGAFAEVTLLKDVSSTFYTWQLSLAFFNE